MGEEEKPRRNYFERKWPLELEQRVVQMRRAGVPYKTLVKETGVPYGTIMKWYNENNRREGWVRPARFSAIAPIAAYDPRRPLESLAQWFEQRLVFLSKQLEAKGDLRGAVEATWKAFAARLARERTGGSAMPGEGELAAWMERREQRARSEIKRLKEQRNTIEVEAEDADGEETPDITA